MSTLMKLAAGGIRLTSAVSPALGGRLALPFFFSTRPRMRVHSDDEATHDAAHREVITVRGNAVETYRWGTGTRAILLMHGWHGRASQFATLVRDLVAEGFRVHSFDAPAHGSSPGARADVRDWVAVARILARTDGPFELVIGHSFGVLAALAAVGDGLDTRRVAAIAGAGEPRAFHDQFARMIGLSQPALNVFEAAFYRRLSMTRTESDARFNALAHPLPSETELLVIHDEADRTLDVGNARALHAAHGARSRLLVTRHLGHNRLLVSDEVLDAVLAFALDGTRGVDAADIRQESSSGAASETRP